MSLSSILRKNTDGIIAAIAGFLVIFFFTRHGGIGISPDSVIYSSAAENLYYHGKLIAFTQYPVVEFPALYPIFLNSLMSIGGKPILFAPVLNALLFALVIFMSGKMMDGFVTHSKIYKWGLLTCIVLSPCLLEVYSMLWTETLFILCVLLFFMGLRRYFESYSRKALILAALIASISSVTRYAGVTLIAAGGLFMLADLHRPLRRKITDLFIYGLVSPSLLIINLVRNYVISGTLMGLREKSITPVHEILHDTGNVFCDWLPFLRGHYGPAFWVAVLVIFGLGLGFVRFFLSHRRITTYENMGLAYSLFYILFMIFSASISRFEALDSRFFSPVFIFLLFASSSWMVPTIRKAGIVSKKWMILAAFLLFAGFQYSQVLTDSETWNEVKDIGIPGYTEDDWKYSETVQYIQQDSLPFQKNHTIYSNSYDAVYFFTGRPGKFLPHKEFKKEVQEFQQDPHCYVIWFNDGDNPDLVEMDFLLQVKKMKLLKEFGDGAIYGFDE